MIFVASKCKLHHGIQHRKLQRSYRRAFSACSKSCMRMYLGIHGVKGGWRCRVPAWGPVVPRWVFLPVSDPAVQGGFLQWFLRSVSQLANLIIPSMVICSECSGLHTIMSEKSGERRRASLRMSFSTCFRQVDDCMKILSSGFKNVCISSQNSLQETAVR